MLKTELLGNDLDLLHLPQRELVVSVIDLQLDYHSHLAQIYIL